MTHCTSSAGDCSLIQQAASLGDWRKGGQGQQRLGVPRGIVIETSDMMAKFADRNALAESSRRTSKGMTVAPRA